ncbi:Hypothetical predicted protein [Mytilus galloprovincialis]|uniref:Novel STAND NTPase 3 domain-containing protein n=1 Tax=Mytilus galloprovincialis TaxID=29158 RepID=A0A8B6C2A6_MYTGA|nr:Hypothetical predicted protein [Mytilus galloprovincialis]
MASLLQEEENFVRLNLLLTGISPRAVRTLFDSEFAPICLDATIKKEFNKLKDLQKKRVINQSQWNLLTPRFPAHNTQILEDWKKNDQMYINTNGADYALKCIKEKSCVTITASSGVGKTATLRHVALQMADEGYDVLLVNDPGDIVKFYNPKQKTLFVIDDLCGNYSFSQIDMKIWEPVIKRLEDILQQKVAKIIVACRLQVYQDSKFETLSLFTSCVCNLLSEKLCLSKTEKKLIAELYLKTKAPKVTDYYDVYECFPLICKLYNDKSDLHLTNFFQNPFTVYEAEIEKLLKKGYYAKYGALALCVMFNNRINEEILTGELDKQTLAVIEHTCEACRLDKGTSRLILKDELDSLIHTYIKKEQNIYKSIHDKVFDILAFHFGQKIIQCLIKHSHKRLICERFILERQEDSEQFIIVVPPKFHQMYMERMVNDWSKGIVNEVFCNTNMNVPKFRKRFLRLLNRLDKSYQRKLAHTSDVENLDTALLLSCFDGDSPMIRWCFQHEADCNVYRNDKTTPMEIAVQQGHTEVVKMLLDRGVDYNKCTSDGFSPLVTACSNGNADIVNVLLEKGADFNKCHNTGWSPLMMACVYGHTEIVRMLLDKGADYNKHSRTQYSAMQLALNKGHTEIVIMLLERGARFFKWSPMTRI